MATNDDESGHVFQVTGNIQNGTFFEDNTGKKLKESASYLNKILVRKVSAAKLLSRVKGSVKQILPPRGTSRVLGGSIPKSQLGTVKNGRPKPLRR
ncbi:hypothetical protein PAAG_12023 [Paracoccidioides lutzii Pb01]|uniref:Uncharacterized protein n=1 Tax=Paracoccidioides lutzii (strain ATCC MYA-826 / Pb01) TaxID=502779 RepID=A0A0A2V4H9_PARBA|nr:hypothetical protein PAAG_12023 [Paracoccidioides lutzii Pb01]KGQ01252.1 hypothetical protein PAAG_12023 [Paracoccidioides lutzii Pb01]